MSRFRSLALSLLLASALFLGGLPDESRLSAQEKPKSEPAKIITVDGVKLNALFYPSAKKNAATVIMLHPIGEKNSIKMDGWQSLAETLQQKDFNVLAFDFRGHGESKELDPAIFWKFPANVSYVRPSTKERNTIDYKDYKKTEAYYAPILINDIAAVKVYLDGKHDEGICNTANTIVIGADNGATLGAIWINSEWNRYKGTFNMMFGLQLDKRAEGNDIVAAVWLNIQPAMAPGGRKLSMGSVLANACRAHAMPAAFLYGEKDKQAKTYDKALVDALKVKKSKKHDGIVAIEVPNTNLSGAKLLTKDLMVPDLIAKFLADNVVPERSNEWQKRDAANTLYFWRDPRTTAPTPARADKSEKTLRFDTYERFLQ